MTIDKKNPLFILEAARNIVTKEHQNTKQEPFSPKLSLVNEEIESIKEFMQENKVDKSLTEDVPLSEGLDNAVTGSFNQDLLIFNSQYTIRSLCNEFSCSFDNITPNFVAKKKNLCCTKLTYLLSKYYYCDSLTKSIVDTHEKFNIKYGKDDLPKLDKRDHFDFEAISEAVEKATYSEYPDFELNRTLLGILSHFGEHFVNEIDSCCYKIELANTFLKFTEKSSNIDFNQS